MKSKSSRLDDLERDAFGESGQDDSVYVLLLEHGSIFKSTRPRRPSDPPECMFAEDIDWDI